VRVEGAGEIEANAERDLAGRGVRKRDKNLPVQGFWLPGEESSAFLKKRTKNLLLTWCHTAIDKSFLVLFFKKELLSSSYG
jgi:hypothetical protein